MYPNPVLIVLWGLIITILITGTELARQQNQKGYGLHNTDENRECNKKASFLFLTESQFHELAWKRLQVETRLTTITTSRQGNKVGELVNTLED